MKLSSLYIYPLKSGAGISLGSSAVDPRGLRLDRRWLVVDEEGRFMTARKHPRMVLIQAIPQEKGGLLLEGAGQEQLSVSAVSSDVGLRPVTIWKDECMGAYLSSEADRWLSDFLGKECHLVHMNDDVERAVDPDYAQPGDIVSFADGYPLLLTTKASLADLNSRVTSPIEMIRFRPNLVLDGCDAFGEDGWKRIRVGSVEFECSRPCSRCVLTTVDPATGIKNTDGEPLTTLKTYRLDGEGVLFGVNLIPRNTGTITLGDPVEILD